MTDSQSNNSNGGQAPANANTECVGPRSEAAGTVSSCEGCPNKSACSTGAFRSPEAIAQEELEKKALKQALSNVSHTVLVLSGKGGVGKSTVASQLAHTLASSGFAVGLLDVDICGPSAPRMLLGDKYASAQVTRNSSGSWLPVYASPNLAVMSISFMLQDTDAAVVWRGPRKNSLIQQFLTEVDWTGDTDGLDYLIVDTPPGTSDEHISTVQYLQKASAVSGAIVVTTPEEVSLSDVRKELNFCEKTKVPVLGVVENMGSYQTMLPELSFSRDGTDCTSDVLKVIAEKCPEILDVTVSAKVFTVSGGGAKAMAEQYAVPHWGDIPLDPKLLLCCEEGKCFADAHPTRPAAHALKELVGRLTGKLPVA